MINLISAINWLSVFAALASYSILGALWFTLFFKKPYLISLGKENVPEQKPAPIFFIGPSVCILIIVITSAILMKALAITSFEKGIEFSLIIGFGYLFANTVNIAINPNIPKPILYGIISGIFHLVGSLITSIILVAMN